MIHRRYDLRRIVWFAVAALTLTRLALHVIDLHIISELTWPADIDAPEFSVVTDAVIAIAALILLLPAIAIGNPVLLTIVSLLGYLVTWGEFLSMAANTMLGMWRSKAAFPLILATAALGLTTRYALPWSSPVLVATSLLDLPGELLLALPVGLACGLLGRNLLAREELHQAHIREAEAIQHAHDAHVAQARTQERARIAREMHDSLAHRLSLLALHSGAMSTARELSAAEARELATHIHELVGEAGQDLRQILAVLHDQMPGDEGRTSWQDVTTVLAQEADAGQHIRLRLSPDWHEAFEAASPRVRHGVLRAIQEFLTNARKHGTDSNIRLDCETSDDGVLLLRCSNSCTAIPSPTPPGEGLGLEGLQERLRLLNGSIHVLRDAKRFTILAVLPTDPQPST